MNTVLQVVTVILLIIGAISTLIPFFPGIPVIFIIFMLYGIFDGFNHITPLFLGGMFAVTILSYAVDNLAGWWGVKRFGASRAGVYGTLLGGVMVF